MDPFRNIKAPLFFMCFSYTIFILIMVIIVGFNFELHLESANASTDITREPSETSVEPSLRSESVFSGIEYPTGFAFLGPDDILVLEQDKGTVQRILHGQMSDKPVLDVNVANDREEFGIHEERGLLGIDIAPDDGNSRTPRYVFLYYTEAEHEDGGEPLGNRLYRYELADNILVNPKLLLDLPVGQNNPAHNGGSISIGPDGNLYLVIGNLLGPGLTNEVEDSLDQNIEDGNEPDGSGGILRVTQDGEAVNGAGILGDEHPLDKYYAYGIRNSFGIDFDPITGNLWDTENGGLYDEINLVSPGFNSGWNKVIGKEGFYQNFDVEDDLVDFEGNGKYSDPEFSWEAGTAPTAIIFFHSDKLGTEFENDIFVGSATGNLYHFELDEDRTHLDLQGDLNDEVADNFDEGVEAILANNLGIITDLEVGPDGYLYGTAYEENGSIFRIIPENLDEDDITGNLIPDAFDEDKINFFDP